MANIGDIVKVDPSRGYGEGVWEVIGKPSTKEVKLKSNGITLVIYEALTYQDVKCKIASGAARKARAEKIGRAKK